MNRTARTLVTVLVLAAAVLPACQRVTDLVSPTPMSSPSPVAQVPSGPRPVLAACDPALQAQAMRPGEVPNWSALDLNACYRLTFDLQPQTGAFSGRARVTYVNHTGAPLTDLVFRTYPNADSIYGGSLQVTDAAVDGVTVSPEVFLADETAVRLPLPGSLEPGRAAVIDLRFEGEVPVNFDGQRDVYGIFNYDSQTQVLILVDAYPLLAVREEGRWEAEPVTGPGDAVVSRVALYEVEVTAPEGWEVITSGVALSSTGDDEEDTSARFVTGPVREFALVASPTLELVETRAPGVDVRHWGLVGGEERWPEALEYSVEAVEVFDGRFGAYPYAELDVVAAPLRNAAGVEYPGLILIGDGLYEPDPERPYRLGIVVSHEVAHQWWYGVVGNDVLEEPWQDEALTTYSSLLFQQARQPQFYEGTLAFYRNTASQVSAEAGDSAVAQPVSAFSDRPGDYGPVVYEKGAVFFAELRARLGDEAFFEALQSYYAENKYELAPPRNLLNSFEEACNCDLDDVYREWGVQ